MLWQRAEPVKPFREWVIIRLNRLHDALAVRRLPKYPIWWLKGILACEKCLSPWMALVCGVALGQGWYAVVNIPLAFAIYNLMLKSPEPS